MSTATETPSSKPSLRSRLGNRVVSLATVVRHPIATVRARRGGGAGGGFTPRSYTTAGTQGGSFGPQATLVTFNHTPLTYSESDLNPDRSFSQDVVVPDSYILVIGALDRLLRERCVQSNYTRFDERVVELQNAYTTERS